VLDKSLTGVFLTHPRGAVQYDCPWLKHVTFHTAHSLTFL
jgi:hypothetical protein